MKRKIQLSIIVWLEGLKLILWNNLSTFKCICQTPFLFYICITTYCKTIIERQEHIFCLKIYIDFSFHLSRRILNLTIGKGHLFEVHYVYLCTLLSAIYLVPTHHVSCQMFISLFKLLENRFLIFQEVLTTVQTT